ncbi:MAG: hypothetical protein H0T12_08045 [Actinobacteria bacterium]|nr:hypothetical protein [Actinomycetota bacterium]
MRVQVELTSDGAGEDDRVGSELIHVVHFDGSYALQPLPAVNPIEGSAKVEVELDIG